MSEKIKVAIIGCGTIATSAHMPGYKANADIAEVEIVRHPQRVTIVIHTARPGVIIGQKGANIERIETSDNIYESNLKGNTNESTSKI